MSTIIGKNTIFISAEAPDSSSLMLCSSAEYILLSSVVLDVGPALQEHCIIWCERRMCDVFAGLVWYENKDIVIIRQCVYVTAGWRLASRPPTGDTLINSEY